MSLRYKITSTIYTDVLTDRQADSCIPPKTYILLGDNKSHLKNITGKAKNTFLNPSK